MGHTAAGNFIEFVHAKVDMHKLCVSVYLVRTWTYAHHTQDIENMSIHKVAQLQDSLKLSSTAVRSRYIVVVVVFD